MRPQFFSSAAQLVGTHVPPPEPSLPPVVAPALPPSSEPASPPVLAPPVLVPPVLVPPVSLPEDPSSPSLPCESLSPEQPTRALPVDRTPSATHETSERCLADEKNFPAMMHLPGTGCRGTMTQGLARLKRPRAALVRLAPAADFGETMDEVVPCESKAGAVRKTSKTEDAEA